MRMLTTNVKGACESLHVNISEIMHAMLLRSGAEISTWQKGTNGREPSTGMLGFLSHMSH